MKMGRSKLKCEGKLPEHDAWSHASGEDPEMDYLQQFASWKGYDAWLDYFKRKALKDPKEKNKTNWKLSLLSDDEEIQYNTEWLLRFLPTVDVNDINPSDKIVGEILPNEQLNQIEDSLLLMLDDDQLYECDVSVCPSTFSKGHSKKVSIDLNAASATDAGTNAKKEENGKDKKKKGKKKESAASKKKKEPPVIVEDLGPQTQMPALLELFNQFDAIQKEKMEFEKSIQPLIYPENLKLALSPPEILIAGFHRYQIYKATYSLINTSTKWIVVTLDKIVTPLSFFFKISGPKVVRMAPGGFQYYLLEFCSDQCDEVHANISYLIKSSDQSLSQRILPVTCLSCCSNSLIEQVDINEEQSSHQTE